MPLSSTMLPSSCSDLQLSMLPLFTIALASPYAAIFFLSIVFHSLFVALVLLKINLEVSKECTCFR
jgi:hypothetical protein